MKRWLPLFACLPLAAAAQPSEPAASPQPLHACVAIEDATDRLACYDAAAGRPTGAPGTTVPAPVIRSRLSGPLREWKPGLRLTLQNGQVWKVADTSGYSTDTTEFPAVTIERSFFGSHWMAVEGLERKIKVQRVK